MKVCLVILKLTIDMNISHDQPSKILLVVQRLSDFVEMKRAATGLKQFGYKCFILFCGVESPHHDSIVLKEIEKSIVIGEVDGVEIFENKSLVTAKKSRNNTQESNPQNIRTKWNAIKSMSPKLGVLGGGEHKEKGYKNSRGKLARLKIKTLKALIIKAHILLLKIKKFKVLLFPLFLIVKCINFFKRNHYKLYSRIHGYFNWGLNLINSPMVYVPRIYRYNYCQFQNILKAGQYNLIILPEDIVGNITPLIIKSGHSLKIPSLILPYTIANQSEAFQALKDRDEFQVKYHTFNKIIGLFCRSWVMKDDTRKVLRLPAEHVLGHLITRASPPDPWMMNSGYANIIAIENEKMFEYYRNSGIPASKMKITGACYDDNLAYYYLNKKDERKKLYRELGIENNKPFFLLGGFPNQITANPPRFDFKDAEDAVNFIVDCIEVFKQDYEIIFRPHPNYLELSDLFAKKNILVTQIDTARLVALSDIYLAFASATIRWAIACGIPTINYDMFYYDFSDYKNVNGVLNACTKEEFKLAVNTMKQLEHFMVIKKQLDTEKRKWGNLDGKSTHRINDLVKELIHLKKVHRKAS
ncbi:TPA: hypothetical protein J8X10_003026 [Legionella pneumophila]|nr:hypothetical protein [Legionella pneumophila]